MDPLTDTLGGRFATQQLEFVYRFFEASELEARSLERYLLLTLGAMYSYLVTHDDIPARLQYVAWCAPAVVVLFAALRAMALGRRQCELIQFLARAEATMLPPENVGWATSFGCKLGFVGWTGTALYVLLLLVTAGVAVAMLRKA